MKYLENISQVDRVASIIKWISSTEHTTREVAKKLIKEFHPDIYHESIKNELIMKNLVKCIQQDLMKIGHSGIIIDQRKLKMEEVAYEFDDENVKNQWGYKIDGINIPIQNVFGKGNLLSAIILRNNLKFFNNTAIQIEIDKLVDTIDGYVDLKNEVHLDIFTNLDTGQHDYSHLSDDIEELIEGMTIQSSCNCKYKNLKSTAYKKVDIIPIKFISFNNTIYVFAFKLIENEYRYYNLSRFRHNSVISDNKKSHINLPKYDFDKVRKQNFGIVDGRNPIKVKLEFIPPAVNHIKGRKWHFSPKTSYKKNGNMLMDMNMCLTTELVSWIMRWMPNVIIHEPDELVTMVKKRLLKSLENNNWQV